MGCVIGHEVHLGLPNYRNCKCQVVHSAPKEDRMYKSISESERMQEIGIQLCKLADQGITIGPKLAEAYKRYLRPVKQEKIVFDLTPSIFFEFFGRRASH